MQDVLYIGIMTGFFAVCVGFVKLCERIIGPDIELESASDATGSDDVFPIQERVA
jgi:hypothetical protein